MTRRSFLGLLISAMLPTTVSARSSEWPPLPVKGFIRGRAATKADTDTGNAVFATSASAGDAGLTSTPLDLVIPQYAYFNDGPKKVPVIVVQAEEAKGRKLIGARFFDGKPVVGFITDFELLGTTPPKQRP